MIEKADRSLKASPILRNIFKNVSVFLMGKISGNSENGRKASVKSEGLKRAVTAQVFGEKTMI